jgi:hypothetical protein
MKNGTFGATLNFVEGTDTYSLGLVNVAKADSGQPLFPTVDPVVATNFTMERVDAFAEVEDGLSRVIGFGIEVIDTTAQLSKQGSLCAYKMPTITDSTVEFGYLNNAGTAQTQRTHVNFTAPPSTVSEAILYRSSVQWEAKDGAYMTVGQEGVNNPFRSKRDCSTVIKGGSLAAGQAIATAPTLATAAQAPPLLTACTSGASNKFVSASQSGIFLSGLANTATFKIRVRVYVERAPLRGDTNLIPLATPSAAYDPAALVLYSRLVTELPVAVPVGFNAHGDWWRMIVNVLKKVIPIAGSIAAPILGPEVAALGAAIGAAIPQQQLGKKNNNKNAKKTKQIVKR